MRVASNDTNTVLLHPAFVVVRCSIGTKVKYTIGTESVEWTATEGITTPKLVSTDPAGANQYQIGTIAATTGNDWTRHCAIELYTGTEASHILIATVSLWENLPLSGVVSQRIN